MRWPMALVSWLLLLFCCLGVAGCGTSDPGEPNLLHGRAPTHSLGVERAAVLSDGVVSRTGGAWRSDLTAVFKNRKSFVEFDLGVSTPIAAAYLQGDNNDRYEVLISEDGKKFESLWLAPTSRARGMRHRYDGKLSGRGRIVRVRPASGDRSFSLSEVQLFAKAPASPPRPTSRTGVSPGERPRSALMRFGLALLVFLGLTRRGARWWWNGPLLLIPLASTVWLVSALLHGWPPEGHTVPIARAVAAFVAALAVAREVVWKNRHPAWPAASFVALALGAVLACSSFFNLGHPQFWDHAETQPEFVHHYDMRVYYPVAKYFDELSFDGLYLASVAAYIDDDPKVTAKTLGKTKLRDLKTHRMTEVAGVKDQIVSVRTRFSPERWTEFVTDMRYFRQHMGTAAYLKTLTDHGGNATPYWMAVSHLLFAHTQASDFVLTLGGLLDPLLLLITFGFVARVFGPRTALLTAVMFGANDFYMFGTNWAGATLRHDWLAFLGLGICALRVERWRLGGALIAVAAMIRAFPAIALFVMVIPAVAWVVERWVADRRRPTIREFYRVQRPLFQVALGAIVTALLAFAFASIVLSPGAWKVWLAKVALLEAHHTNNVSLRALVGGNDAALTRILSVRWPIHLASIFAFAALLIAALRRRSLDQVALMGLFLIPVAFNPSNYYMHFVYLLPLLAVERVRRREGELELELGELPVPHNLNAALWLVPLGLCVAQYASVQVSGVGLHFWFSSALLIAGLAALLLLLIRSEETLRVYDPGSSSGAPTSVPPGSSKA